MFFAASGGNARRPIEEFRVETMMARRLRATAAHRSRNPG